MDPSEEIPQDCIPTSEAAAQAPVGAERKQGRMQGGGFGV